MAYFSGNSPHPLNLVVSRLDGQCGAELVLDCPLMVVVVCEASLTLFVMYDG